MDLTSCQYIGQTEIGPIKSGVKQVDDGRLKLTITIAENGKQCDQPVSLTRFNGSYMPYSTNMSTEDILWKMKLLQFEVVRPKPWLEGVDFTKLSWSVSNKDTIGRNGYSFQIKGRFVNYPHQIIDYGAGFLLL